MSINFLIGTKAQFIKCIPVINEAINRSISVNLYDLKQHPQTTKELKVKIIDTYQYIELSSNSKDLGSYWELIKWFAINLFKFLLFPSKEIKKEICIVHGDTLSTLLGVVKVKRSGGKLVLLESGHKVPGIFKHFPESIIRYISAKFSDILIVNGIDQINQLESWKVKGDIIEISQNTIYESVLSEKLTEREESNIVLVSIHRTENLNNKNSLLLLTQNLISLTEKYKIIWCLHIPTKNKIKKYKLYDELIKNGVVLKNLIPYKEFLTIINNSEFVITDGGGVVEECRIIGTPTLVWRNEHLDQNHLFDANTNLQLSYYNQETIDSFIKNYKKYKNLFQLRHGANPSSEILDNIQRYI